MPHVAFPIGKLSKIPFFAFQGWAIWRSFDETFARVVFIPGACTGKHVLLLYAQYSSTNRYKSHIYMFESIENVIHLKDFVKA